MKDAKPRLLIRALEAEGFVKNGGSKHIKMVKMIEGKPVTIAVSNHGVIKRATVERYRKQSGIPKDRFYSYKF